VGKPSFAAYRLMKYRMVNGGRSVVCDVTWRGNHLVNSTLSDRLRWKVVRTIRLYSNVTPISVKVVICNNPLVRNTRIIPVMIGQTRHLLVAKREFAIIFKMEDVVQRVADRVIHRNPYYRLA
jgi:hypothetical protein